MKGFFIIFILIIGFASCNSYKSSTGSLISEENDTIRIKNDSLEYEILIIEPGFNSWLYTQRPRGYYSQGYLENRNVLYVTEYNMRVRNFQIFDPLMYPQEINYDFSLDYGYEVNYLLYNYFIYFQQKFKQKLIGGRNY